MSEGETGFIEDPKHPDEEIIAMMQFFDPDAQTFRPVKVLTALTQSSTFRGGLKCYADHKGWKSFASRTKNHRCASMLVSRGEDHKLGVTGDLGAKREVACEWCIHHGVMCIRKFEHEKILLPLPQDMREGIDIDSEAYWCLPRTKEGTYY